MKRWLSLMYSACYLPVRVTLSIPPNLTAVSVTGPPRPQPGRERTIQSLCCSLELAQYLIVALRFTVPLLPQVFEYPLDALDVTYGRLAAFPVDDDGPFQRSWLPCRELGQLGRVRRPRVHGIVRGHEAVERRDPGQIGQYCPELVRRRRLVLDHLEVERQRRG